MEQLLFKSGEFAQMCGTTKESLRHYHNIGLLSPCFTDSNKYQYYSALQLLDYLLINSLQSSGCTLGEIKAYLCDPSETELRSVLAARADELAKESKALKQKERLLRNTLKRIEMIDGLASKEDFWIQECEEEYYLISNVSSGGADERVWLNAIQEHLSYCKKVAAEEEFQFTALIGSEAFLLGNYHEDYSLCNRISRKIKSPRLHIKPKGTYLCMLHNMSLADVPSPEDFEIISSKGELMGKSSLSEEKLAAKMLSVHAELQTHIKENNYKVLGGLYETELSVYTGASAEHFSSLLAIEVERV